MLSAQARSFADMPGAAWKMMLPLAEHAPANAELRRVLGDIAAGRGWPRRSAEEIEIAASLAPEDKAAQVALAESAIRRRHWKEARSRTAELAAIYPNDVHVRRLQTDLRAHDAFELQTEFHVNKEYGGSSSDANQTSNSPGSGTDWTARLYTPPVAEYWRFIGAWEHHTAKVTEGRALRYRYGAGVELALPDLTVEAIGWSNEGDISQLGASLAVAWHADRPLALRSRRGILRGRHAAARGAERHHGQLRELRRDLRVARIAVARGRRERLRLLRWQSPHARRISISRRRSWTSRIST